MHAVRIAWVMGGFVVYAAYAPVDSTLLSRDIELKEDPQTRQINWIKGNFLANKSLEKKQVATQFLSQAFSLTSGDPSVRAARSHREPAIDFVLNRETRDALTNNTIVRLQQTVNNVPIFGREIAVHITPYNAVRLVIGSVMDTAIDTNPTLSADQATTVARQHIANHASGDYVVTQAAALSLVVHESIPQLVWHLVIEPVGRLGARWQYFVDAHTGDIDRFNSTPSHLNRTVYEYKSSESTYNSNSILKEGGNQDGIEPVFTDPYQFVGYIDQYFTNHHNHHGINEQDPLSIKILVDPDPSAEVNARYRYKGEQDYFMFHGSVESHLAQDLDVVAHEYCHGITTHTSGLIYSFQSGALNESMSDICAVLVDDFVKESGEQDAEIWSIAEVGFGSPQPLRRMDTPANAVHSPQPDHMDNFRSLYLNEDNGGVHINSGIVNKAFYAVAQGVGLANAAKIYYRAWVTYFNRDTNFVKARWAVEQAAIDLYGSEAQSVVQGAFDSVGILDTVGASESASPDSTNSLGFLAGPNPYRGAPVQNITFQFDLPREANVLIQVYSLSGRLVYEHEARYGAGIKKAAWDARDLSGVPVANGMYAAYIVAKQDGARWVKKQAIGILR